MSNKLTLEGLSAFKTKIDNKFALKEHSHNDYVEKNEIDTLGFLPLTGGTITGNINPNVDNAVSLGTSDKRFKEIYTHELKLSTNSLYIGDTKILGTDAQTVNIKTDAGQSLALKSQGSGSTMVQSFKEVALQTVSENGINPDGSRILLNAIGEGSSISLTAPTTTITSDTTIKNLVVTGNLTVSGTTTTVSSKNLDVTDNMITINKGETGSDGVTAKEAGIRIDRGDKAAYFIMFDENDDMFKVGMQNSLEIIASRPWVTSQLSGLTASKLSTSSVGSATKPVYFAEGIPVACTYSLGKDVPSNADFTNTWRDIVDNLTSDSSVASLSAAQGKVLKGLVDGKADSDHTHSQYLTAHNPIDTELNTTSTNAVQNKVVAEALSGKAATSHGNHVPVTQSADNAVFLRNDNTWQTVTPANIGAAAATHSHSQYLTAHNPIDTALSTTSTNAVQNKVVATALNGKADASHGNHVPTVEAANNTKFLRNDNTWAVVTPENIGAATSDHTHSQYLTAHATVDTALSTTSTNAVQNKVVTEALNGKAASSHGTHVPTPETANVAKFLRNDNTWQLVTPANIGASASDHTHSQYLTEHNPIDTALSATSTNAVENKAVYTALSGKAATSHGNHVPATQTADNAVFLRNDNTWQTVTAANIGAAEAEHTHSQYLTAHNPIDTELSTTSTNAVQNKVVNTAISAKYTKPSTGIPKTDLDSAVQTSLGKADSALQSYTETDPIFVASAAHGITSDDITNWNGKANLSGATFTGNVTIGGTTINATNGHIITATGLEIY